ncbi:hypothetical protein N824_06615 [Pedobacter sp. V48]|nr:hypothetical protein N824_06615 [Pedobacter sp. V48]
MKIYDLPFFVIKIFYVETSSFISSYFSDCKYRTNVFKMQNQNINIFFNLLQHKYLYQQYALLIPVGY